MTEEKALLQMQHLRTHPAVLSPLCTGEVDLHGWVYDIKHGTVALIAKTRSRLFQ
jgi:carbonic anhydrase